MAKPVTSIAASWASFDRAVMPPGISDVQRREMRRAFYAGAASLLRVLMDELDEGDELTDNDMTRMVALNGELQQFAEDLKQGRA